ncbi:MAG: DUF2231 domain-containing protein [Armatimonadota bacterium]
MLNLLYWHPSFMLNSHPLVVHFPIALWTAAFIFALLWLIFRKPTLEASAIGALVLGTAIAVVTAATGLHAAATVPHPDAAHELLEDHESLAIASFVVAAVLSVWRLVLWQKLRKIQAAFPVALLALAVMVNLTADLGGRLVYRYGIGTTAVKISPELSHQYEESHGEQPGHGEHEH